MSDEMSILGYQPVARSTKAEQFLGKIHGLTDFYERLLNKTGSLPTGKEVANYLKYFQHLLLSWVKDIQPHFDEDTREFNYSEFPTVDYSGLYQSLILLLQVSKNVESDPKEYADGILKTISCLVPFLETDAVLSMPLHLISCLGEMPNSTHSSMISLLCSYIIPVSYGCMAPNKFPERHWVLSSTSSILLNTLQFCAESGLWMKTMECLMTHSEDIRCHLISVLAYGDKAAAEPAIFLLNRYFPPLDIGSVKAYQAAPYDSMPSYKCQSISCPSNNSVNASKVCLDPGFCAEALGTPPPVYFCVLCVQTYCITNSPLCLDIIYPLGTITDVCEDLKCTSNNRKATFFCFDPDCIAKNQFRPMRLCVSCFRRTHDPGTGGEKHVTHRCLDDLWMMQNPEQTYLVDAIKALLSEAQPVYQLKCIEMGVEFEISAIKENQDPDELACKKIFRSFHGLWLLRSLCHVPPSAYHFEHLGRLLAMLFSWTEAVAYIKYPRIIQLLKKVQEQANVWGHQVMVYDQDLYCNCLLPVPPIYARVGYPWEALMSKVHQLLEGLQKLSTLLKFGLIPEPIWERVMPLWMQEIKESVPADEIFKFVTILRKFFDYEQVYYPSYALSFIGKRLDSVIYRQKQEALVWIQMLSALDVQLEYDKLLDMFNGSSIEVAIQEGSTASVFPFPDYDTLQTVAMSPMVQSPASTPLAMPFLTSVSDGLSYYILVMDVIIKQMSLRSKADSGLGLAEENNLLRLLTKMLEESWTGEHANHLTEECQQCRFMMIFFYQINLLIEILIPNSIDRSLARKDITLHDVTVGVDMDSVTVISDEDNTTVHESVDGNHDVNAVIDQVFKPITSFDSVDSEGELSTGSIEDWRETVFRYGDGFRKKVHSISSAVSNGSSNSAWSALMSSHPELQVLEGLLKELQKQRDSSVLQQILSSVSVILIRGDFLGVIKGDEAEFLYRMQNTLLIPGLWSLLESNNSMLAQSAVPLILYCTSYAFGAERVSDEISAMFNNVSWRVRFSAVEKVALLSQFLETEFVCDSSLAQSTVVNAFAHLVSSADDLNTAVAERARSLLTSMKCSSLKIVYKYLELQFSQEPSDRVTILRTFRAIDQIMPDLSRLCGEFFLRLLKDVDVDPRHGSVVAALVRTGSGSVTSDFDVNSRASLISKSISSPAKSHINSAARRISLARPRSHSIPLASYRRKYTLQFDRHRNQSFSKDVDDTDGSIRRRRVGTFSSTPAKSKISQDGALLGGRIQSGLDTVAEESNRAYRKRSSVSSTTSSIMSGHSDRSFIHQEPEKEVCHELMVTLLRFLSDKERCKEKKVFGTTAEKDIRNLTDHVGALMGYKGVFVVEPHELRQGTVFQSFLLNVPELLDCNEKIAEKFLPLCLTIMSYCLKEIGDLSDSSKDTLARIAPNVQYSWLMTSLIFFYKYDFQSYQEEAKELIRITRNTIASSSHEQCRLKSTHTNRYRTEESLAKGGGKKARIHKTLQKLARARAAKRDEKRYAPLGKSDSGGVLSETIEMSDLGGTSLTSSPATFSKTSTVSVLCEQSNGDKVSSQLVNAIATKIKEDEAQATLSDILICRKCGLPISQYGEDVINLCLVVLSTFIHRSPDMAAPLLMDIYDTVGRSATIPGACSSIARQFFRCTLLQLAPKGVFQEIFRSTRLGKTFFEGMALSLYEFPQLNEMKPLEFLFSDYASRDDPNDRLPVMLHNLFLYLEALPKDPINPWRAQIHSFESFFKHLGTGLLVGTERLTYKNRTDPRLVPVHAIRVNRKLKLGGKDVIVGDFSVLLRIMAFMLGLGKNFCKTLLPFFAQITSQIVRKGTFKLRDLQELCSVCCESFSKERDQMSLTKTVLHEAALCMKLRHAISAKNVKLLYQFLFLDGQSWFTFDHVACASYVRKLQKMPTRAVKAFQVYYNDAVDFLKTWNFKLKGSKDSPVDEETSQIKAFPILIKAAVGQIIALKLKDQLGASKVHGRVLAFVRVSPQGGQLGRVDQVPEIVSHIRVLSWILLGAVNHTVDTPDNSKVIYCLRIGDNSHIADYIEVVLLSLVDQEQKSSKKSNVTPLYYAFLLCEIWSVYCELLASQKVQSEGNPISSLIEFWGRVTFVILQLLQRRKGAFEVETVNLFVCTLDTLAGCAKQVFSQVPDSKIRKFRESQHLYVDKEEAKGVLRDWIGKTRACLASLEQLGRRPVDPTVVV